MILGVPPADATAEQTARQAVRDHILMRDVFHCTPGELRAMDKDDILLHWDIREAIRAEEEREANRARKRYNRR